LSLIKINSYYFKYRGLNDWILKNINLILEKGETLLILGPNGSGKSTLALSILGIAQRYPSEYKGEIYYKGKNILEYDRTELARYCSIVQQDPEAQLVTLFVEDEVAFGLENLLYKDIEERISRALKLVRMENKRHEETYALSYGEKQKTILASVIALDNELLILDEPTSNLDAISRKEFFSILKDLKRRGTTMIIIEHNIDEIYEMIDKVIILNKKGEIVSQGTFPKLIYDLDLKLLEELGIWLPTSLELEILKKIGINTNKEVKIENKKTIEIRDLFFKYKKPVIQGISFSFYSGKLYAILGRNGSGKTTLCKIIAGILKNYKGFLNYYGIKNIKFCFQNPDLQFVKNSVYEELELSLKLSKRNIKIEELLEQFGLGDKAKVNPHLLSEGQKKLLTIVSSLLYEPDVLIFDEPTFALDRFNARKIMSLLRKLSRENKTVIFTTHDVRFCLEYADEVLLLEDGKLSFAGTIHDFIENFEKFHEYFPSSLEHLDKEQLKKYVVEIRKVLGNEI